MAKKDNKKKNKGKSGSNEDEFDMAEVSDQIREEDPQKYEERPPTPTLSQIMMSDAAMTNLYYISHDAPHALEIRGFDWPDNPRGKKKKKK